MPQRIAGFTVGLLLPQPLLRVEDEPDAIQRQIKGGRRRGAGAVTDSVYLSPLNMSRV